jgi:hypothetical protein
MISSQLTNVAIIGCQFLREYGIVIDFHKGTFSYVRGTELREHLFTSKGESRDVRSKDQRETENPSLLNNLSRGHRPKTPPADCESNIPTRAANSCSDPNPYHTVRAGSLRYKERGEEVWNIPLNEKTQCRSDEGEEKLEDNGSLYNGTESDRFIDKLMNKSNSTPSSPRVGFACLNTARELNLNAECSRRNLPDSDPIPKPKSDFSDPRSLRKTDLFSLVEQADLNVVQKRQLYEILVKYISHMTTTPRRCNLFSNKFQVNADKPIVGYSRPIPFATRPAVREKINQMMKDGILEISTSPILNPLTVVSKEGKSIRICVDARKVNQFTVPDRERSQPLHELLQRFNGARYLTSLDLSSAYLQVELQEESRKYTAFLFDSTVY